MNRIKEFFEGVKKEMGKVSWPTQRELVDNTTVVLIFSVIISLFIFGVDQVYSTVLEVLYP